MHTNNTQVNNLIYNGQFWKWGIYQQISKHSQDWIWDIQQKWTTPNFSRINTVKSMQETCCLTNKYTHRLAVMLRSDQVMLHIDGTNFTRTGSIYSLSFRSTANIGAILKLARVPMTTHLQTKNILLKPIWSSYKVIQNKCLEITYFIAIHSKMKLIN